MGIRYVLALSLLAALFAQPLHAAAAPGYRLHQRSDFYGVSVAEVSAKSMRLSSDRLHLKLHVAAPDYQLTALNDRNRQYARMPFKRWEGFVGDTRRLKARRQVFRGYVNICGLRAEEWWVDSAKRDSVENAACKDLWYNGESYNTHYFVTKEVAPPKDTYGVFSNALGMPGYLGLPIRMIQYTRAGKPYVTFDTTKVEKCDIKETLAIPKEYALAADEMSLLISAAVDKKQLAGLMDDDDDSFLGELNSPKHPPKQREQLHGWVPGMEAPTGGVGGGAKDAIEGSWTPGD